MSEDCLYLNVWTPAKSLMWLPSLYGIGGPQLAIMEMERDGSPAEEWLWYNQLSP